MESSGKKRILIIEDDSHIAEGIKLNLSLQGYEVDIAPDGVSGLQQWQAGQPHLIILDIMMPGMDGFSVLQSIRLQDERLPILILSARGSLEDRVKGLTCGVDDYLAKPFDLEELLLRVERPIARASWTGAVEQYCSTPALYTFGDNRISIRSMEQVGLGDGKPVRAVAILTFQDREIARSVVFAVQQPQVRRPPAFVAGVDIAMCHVSLPLLPCAGSRFLWPRT